MTVWKDNMGLTSWASDTIRRSDVEVAKNYLTQQALDKAHAEYTKYKNRLGINISPVEQDFIKSIDTLEAIADSSKK